MAEDIKGHIIIFQHENFRGRHRHIYNEEPNLNDEKDNRLNDAVSSFIVVKGRWKLYRDSRYVGAFDQIFEKGMYKRCKDYDVKNDDISSLRCID